MQSMIVAEALRSFPHIAEYCLTGYPVSRQIVYLRTVIVTAAVYRGFGRKLHPYGLTSFLNLPAPGRRQTLYILLRVSRVLCF